MALVKHTNNSLSNITALPSAVPTGNMTLLSTATASSSASLSFNSTYINSDYLVYKFEFINIHIATDTANFTFNLSTNNGSNYNVTKTTTHFVVAHYESDAATTLEYKTDYDLAHSTAFKIIADNVGNGADESVSGFLDLYNPSSTTYVKHFISRVDKYQSDNASYDTHSAGYGNTTSAVNAIQFKMSSGNIDSGQIKLYGLGS